MENQGNVNTTEETRLVQNVEPIKVVTQKSGGDTNILLSIANLSNAAIGMGMFSFPFAYHETGLVSGLVLTLALVLFSCFTLCVLCAFGGEDCPNYQSVVKKHLGKKIGFVSEMILIFLLIGGCVGFLNIIGDISSPVMTYWLKQWGAGKLVFLADRRIIIALATLLVILPITYFKNMKVLGVASFIAIFSAAYTVIYVDVKGGIHLAENGFATGTNLWINIAPNFFIAIPLICLSFQCHIHVIPIYHSLSKPSYLRMFVVIVTTMIICFLFYASVGFFGYSTFGSAIRGNAMLNYPLDDIFAGIGRFNVGILVALSYPLRYFATRNVIESLFFKTGLGSELDYVITTVFVVFTIIASILIPDIVDVFGIIGSIGAVSVMFIFPGLLLWTKKGIFWKLISVPVVVVGVFMGIVGTTATVMSIIKKYF